MAEAARAPERTVYEAGAGRKTALSLAFLILLPFYLSLPAMLARRLVHGLWFDTIGLILFSALFTGLMALLGVQLYLSLRSRVALGETAVRITLPQGGGAAGPRPRCISSTRKSPTRRSQRSRRARCCSAMRWRQCCCGRPACS